MITYRASVYTHDFDIAFLSISGRPTGPIARMLTRDLFMAYGSSGPDYDIGIVGICVGRAYDVEGA